MYLKALSDNLASDALVQFELGGVLIGNGIEHEVLFLVGYLYH